MFGSTCRDLRAIMIPPLQPYVANQLKHFRDFGDARQRTIRGEAHRCSVDSSLGSDPFRGIQWAGMPRKVLQVAGQHTENFGERVADELAAMVEKNTTLAELDIPGIRLGAVGGIKLANALEKNTTLRNLNLYCNTQLLSSQDGVVGHNVVAWASAIEKNTGLQKLNMWATGCVSDEGGALIGKALGRNTMLETFHIIGDRYMELSGEAFADAIEANVTLKELNLGHENCALTPESQKRIDRVVHSRGGKLKVGMKR